MKPLSNLAVVFLCIVLFTNCSKKTTENFTPTETFHPPKVETKVSKNPPNILDATFWIGPSMNHSFSIQDGSVDMKGVYAINNKKVLDKDPSGNLLFYPKKSLSELEFFKSEIGNLDFEEGYLYQVEGSKYYLGPDLWGVIVDKVLQKIEYGSNKKVEEKVVIEDNKKTTKTITKTNIKTKKSTKNLNKGKSKVSTDPPSHTGSIFWIGSSRSHSFSTSVANLDVKDAYAVNSNPNLKKDASGNLMFYPKDALTELEFFDSKIDNFDYKEGFYYQIKGTKYYLGSRLAGISVDKVLQKVKDRNHTKSNNEIKNLNITDSWHPSKPDKNNNQEFDNLDNDSKPISMVSKDPPSRLEGTFWIGSSRNVSHTTPNGHIKVNNCYVINNREELAKNASGDLVFYSNSNVEGLESFCDKINGLDNKEGYYYQVRGTKLYGGKKLKRITVDKVINKVKDRQMGDISEMIVFIGPEIMNGQEFQSNGVNCYQIQYEDYSRSAEWDSYCGSINGFNYKPGFIYKLKIKRTTSNSIGNQFAGGAPPVKDELIAILRIRRM